MGEILGLDLNAALVLAKRDMIRGGLAMAFSDRVSASLAHPLFWGPYILVGEMK